MARKAQPSITTYGRWRSRMARPSFKVGGLLPCRLCPDAAARAPGQSQGYRHAHGPAQGHAADKARVAPAVHRPAQHHRHDGEGEAAAAAGGAVVNGMALGVQAGDPAVAHVLHAVDQHTGEGGAQRQHRQGCRPGDAEVEQGHGRRREKIKEPVAPEAVAYDAPHRLNERAGAGRQRPQQPDIGVGYVLLEQDIGEKGGAGVGAEKAGLQKGEAPGQCSVLVHAAASFLGMPP